MIMESPSKKSEQTLSPTPEPHGAESVSVNEVLQDEEGTEPVPIPNTKQPLLQVTPQTLYSNSSLIKSSKLPSKSLPSTTTKQKKKQKKRRYIKKAREQQRIAKMLRLVLQNERNLPQDQTTVVASDYLRKIPLSKKHWKYKEKRKDVVASARQIAPELHRCNNTVEVAGPPERHSFSPSRILNTVHYRRSPYFDPGHFQKQCFATVSAEGPATPGSTDNSTTNRKSTPTDYALSAFTTNSTPTPLSSMEHQEAYFSPKKMTFLAPLQTLALSPPASAGYRKKNSCHRPKKLHVKHGYNNPMLSSNTSSQNFTFMEHDAALSNSYSRYTMSHFSSFFLAAPQAQHSDTTTTSGSRNAFLCTPHAASMLPCTTTTSTTASITPTTPLVCSKHFPSSWHSNTSNHQQHQEQGANRRRMSPVSSWRQHTTPTPSQEALSTSPTSTRDYGAGAFVDLGTTIPLHHYPPISCPTTNVIPFNVKKTNPTGTLLSTLFVPSNNSSKGAATANHDDDNNIINTTQNSETMYSPRKRKRQMLVPTAPDQEQQPFSIPGARGPAEADKIKKRRTPGETKEEGLLAATSEESSSSSYYSNKKSIVDTKTAKDTECRTTTATIQESEHNQRETTSASVLWCNVEETAVDGRSSGRIRKGCSPEQQQQNQVKIIESKILDHHNHKREQQLTNKTIHPRSRTSRNVQRRNSKDEERLVDPWDRAFINWVLPHLEDKNKGTATPGKQDRDTTTIDDDDNNNNTRSAASLDLWIKEQQLLFKSPVWDSVSVAHRMQWQVRFSLLQQLGISFE